MVLSDLSGIRYRNGGPESAPGTGLPGDHRGEDVLDALVAGVNIPELDPEETGIGYGGLPNGEGVVQLDASVMHGPRRWAGAVAGLEGVRTPLPGGPGGGGVHRPSPPGGARGADLCPAARLRDRDELNTPRSREALAGVEAPGGLQPMAESRRPPPGAGSPGRDRSGPHRTPRRPGGRKLQELSRLWYDAGLEMVREGLDPRPLLLGTIQLQRCGNPGTGPGGGHHHSALAWKIPAAIGALPHPGRRPLYVRQRGGAAAPPGGEANLFNLSSFLCVGSCAQGIAPEDAGMAVLERIRSTRWKGAFAPEDGTPASTVRFFLVEQGRGYRAACPLGHR